jgi:hypothetical protein
MSAVHPFMMGGALGSRPTAGLSGFWGHQSPTIESRTDTSPIGFPAPVMPNAAINAFNPRTPNFYGSGLRGRAAKRRTGGCETGACIGSGAYSNSGRGFYTQRQKGTRSAIQYNTGQPASKREFMRPPSGVSQNAYAHAGWGANVVGGAMDIGGAGTKAGAAKNKWIQYMRGCAQQYQAQKRSGLPLERKRVPAAAPVPSAPVYVPQAPLAIEAPPPEVLAFPERYQEAPVPFEYEQLGPAVSAAEAELKHGLAAAPLYREERALVPYAAPPSRKRKAEEKAHEVHFAFEPRPVSLRKQYGELAATVGEAKRARVFTTLEDITQHLTPRQLAYLNRAINALTPASEVQFLDAAGHVWRIRAPAWLSESDPINDYNFEQFRVATIMELTDRGVLPLATKARAQIQGSGFRGGDFFGDIWSGIKKGAEIVSKPLQVLKLIPGVGQAVIAPISAGVEFIKGAGMSAGPAYRPFQPPKAARLPGRNASK